MLNQIAAIHGTDVAAATNSFESIATANGTGSSGTITFTSIPSTYKHLQIRYIARDTRAASGGNTIYMTFNSDTGTNYSNHDIEGNGSTTIASAAINQTRINWGLSTSNNDLANTYATGVFDLLDYSNTNKYKTSRWLTGYDANGNGLVYFISGNWRSTSAVNRIDINTTLGNFTTATQFALYGIKG